MEYYIITDISENYNYVNDLAYRCKMEIIDYLKYSIMTCFNVDIQNIKIIDNNISCIMYVYGFVQQKRQCE